MAQDKSLNKLLIVSITPYFLEKQVFWFDENLDEILQSTKTQSFFQDNTIFLKKGQSHNLSGLLRKLDEMGYERVFTIQAPGEFSQKGGVIDIFPINTNQAMRLDFLGNNIENIQPLNIKVENEQNAKDILKKKLKSQKLFSDLKNIKPDDYLVHLDHGVAKFSGMEKIKDHEYYVVASDMDDFVAGRYFAHKFYCELAVGTPD